ncbi:hypothetical protein [Nocardioides acrostichi]|uniref:ATP synthase protein I n=1 Tax=Nocardioides acrostichi TaxID=2784339 RepID=A0A930UZ99_9ACTN|nr:hypothetical protein [Nocardioides acrostichi]MBF4162821.1 hypothetical protein [Nocardioides acrostichi]
MRPPTAMNATNRATAGPRSRPGTPLLVAASAALVAVLLVLAVGTAVSGGSGAGGALVGGGLVLAVLVVGAVVVNATAARFPELSLAVALGVFTLEAGALLVAFATLDGSTLLDGTLSRGWLAGAVAAGAFGWMVGHTVGFVRLRIPAFEEPGVAAVGEARRATSGVGSETVRADAR